MVNNDRELLELNRYPRSNVTVYGDSDDLRVHEAPHRFVLADSSSGLVLQEIKIEDRITDEMILDVLLFRLRSYQGSDYACEENSAAIKALNEASVALAMRRSKRLETKE